MDVQQRNLVSMLRSVMTNQPCGELLSPDFEAIFQLARAHKLAGFPFHALCRMSAAQRPSETIQADWRRAATQEAVCDAGYTYEYENLLNLFEQNQISVLPLKGFVLKRVYPKPELRSMGDLDLCCAKQQAEQIYQCLCANGYHAAQFGRTHTDKYIHTTGIYVEVHTDLSNEAFSSEAARYLAGLLEQAHPMKGHRFVLDLAPEDHYIYIMLHLLKHFMHGGTGLRSVLDVWAYRRQVPMNQTVLEHAWKRFGIEGFAANMEQLADAWMDNTRPSGVQQRLGDYLVGSGVYGNTQNLVANLVTDAGTSVYRKKWNYMRKRLFWPYQKMKNRFPVLDRAPVLLPVFWVYRLWIALFRERRRLTEELGILRDYTAENTDAVLRLRHDLGLTANNKSYCNHETEEML